MLSLKNIVKEYGTDENKVLALKGVSFDFRKNEFVSILGPSGCGKTTMLNIIGGLDRYTSGDLVIEGKSTKNYNDKDWDAYRNNSVGFVFQSYNLIPHQTVLANVELALELSGVSRAERNERAMMMLEKVGLKDQAHKKPNQLSGGQMQRVAIARALINNPEIILADEPTGALDTETSIQIMELLKEVAKEKLVIMVTHNPELAEKYSTRIIRLLDGEMVDDSNPYKDETEHPEKKSRKPKMGFKTAFVLSLKNLFSKKARTTLTSIAGSIGIIGVALVLALSNGFNRYMARMQTDTLSTYPLTISENSVDLSTFNDMYQSDVKKKYPSLDTVAVRKMFESLKGMLKSNDLSEEFLTYLHDIDEKYYYSIQYDYGFDMNDYIYAEMNVKLNETPLPSYMAVDSLVSIVKAAFAGQLANSEIGGTMTIDMVRSYIPTMTEMPNSPELIKEQYDCLYGKFPDFGTENEYKQLVVVVDEFNRINDITLALLGYLGVSFYSDGRVVFEDKSEFTIEDLLGHKFNYIGNEEAFTAYPSLENTYVSAMPSAEDGEELEIVGILRAKENVNGILEQGLAYTTALTEHAVNQNKESDMAAAARANEGIVYMMTTNITTGQTETVPYSLRAIAGDDSPATISIYAKDFDSKEFVKKQIDDWNDRFEEGDKRIISYSDMMSMMFGMLNTMVSAVTYVLVAFTSISLIVSSVMIGIITYISVVERTKEIGVLRSLGASKHEISNVFNAETFLIGLFAGLIGVVVTYLLSIPINLILGSLIADVGSLAILHPLAALILVVISIGLTLIAGLIPAGIAAKKDPVVALRTE